MVSDGVMREALSKSTFEDGFFDWVWDDAPGCF